MKRDSAGYIERGYANLLRGPFWKLLKIPWSQRGVPLGAGDQEVHPPPGSATAWPRLHPRGVSLSHRSWPQSCPRRPPAAHPLPLARRLPELTPPRAGDSGRMQPRNARSQDWGCSSPRHVPPACSLCFSSLETP